MKCAKPNTPKTADCGGVDLLHAPFDTVKIPVNTEEMNHNLFLLGQPYSASKTIGINFNLPLSLSYTDKNGTLQTSNRTAFVRCQPGSGCNQVSSLIFLLVITYFPPPFPLDRSLQIQWAENCYQHLRLQHHCHGRGFAISW